MNTIKQITTKKNDMSIINRFTVLFVVLLLSACTSSIDSQKASDANAELGVRYLQQGRLKLANEKLLKSLSQNPNSVISNHYFALLQERLEQNQEANKYFQKAISLRPENPEIRNNYGSFLCKTSRPQAAVSQFLAAVKDPLYSTPEFAYTNAGICLRKASRTNDAQAETYFRLALKKRSSFPSALLQMAKLYQDRRNYPKAYAFMSRYESVGKSSPEALKLCATINVKMGDNAKAQSCRSTLLRLFPSSPEAEQISLSL